MIVKTRLAILLSTLALGFAVPLRADEPIIPPSLSKVWPAGMERGTTATFTLDGRNLTGARDVIFDAAGISGKVTDITDVPEKISGPRAGVDLGAQVPLGKKQTAKLEVTVAKDVEPGVHQFRVQTPLGTTDTAVLAIGSLPEIAESPKSGMSSSAEPQEVTLPATLVGTVATPGDTDSYQFSGKAGEELVFQVVASELGSDLESLLFLQDASGHTLAEAGRDASGADAVLTYKLLQDGKYTLSVTDREKGGGMDHFYRINSGALPYVSSVFPLGVRAGQVAEVAVNGMNLGGVRSVKIQSPKAADGWTTLPLDLKTTEGRSLDKVKLVV